MADKSFGVTELNLIGSSGTPTIESPTNINLNAVNVAISTNTTVGGTVGIGTINPVRNLHIHEPSTGNSYLHLTNVTTGGTTEDGFSLYLQSDGSTWYRARESTGKHIWTTVNTETMRLTADGNLGIGTTNPGSKLDVRGDLNVTGITTTAAVSWGGHMLPTSNAAYDIGSAELKVRHLFLSDNSLKFVDSSDTEHPLSLDSGRLKFGGGLLLGNTIKVDSASGILTATSFSGGGNDIVTSRWTIGANGSSDYTFTGPGGLSAANDPKIYLARGQTYEFVMNTGGGHPFQIQTSGGAAYNTGVTNNGASSGTIKFEVPFDAPNTLQYKCTSHSSMGNTIIVYPDLSP